MARKTLLTEGELRRFMKLADMRPIADTRINEMGGFGLEEEMPGDEEVEDLDATVAAGEEEGPPADVLDLDEPMDEPMDDLGGEPADPELEAKFAEFMTQVAAVAQEVLGVDVEVEGGEELGGEEEVEEFELSDEEAPMGDLAPEGGDEELEVGAEVEEEEPVPGMRYEGDKDEDIVAEVARRVATRLQRENHQAQVVDQLAERIMKRLTK